MSMSFSSNLSVADAGGVARHPVSPARRAVLRALTVAPWLCLSPPAGAGNDVRAGLKRWGSGEFRRFGILVYAATLWAGDDPQRPPRMLRLDYKRHIEGRAIVEASVREMRRFVADEARLRYWGEAMHGVFPDVNAGDHIVGLHAGDHVTFHQDGRLLGSIDAPGFAENFFSIWLDARTSAPALRAALLRPPER